jgi:hypothetical protein
LITDIVRALVLAGASPEMILAAVEAAETNALRKEEERLAKGRARTAKHRNSKRNGDVTQRDVTLQSVTSPLPSPMVSPHTPLPITPSLPPKEKTPKGVQKKTPFDELSSVLDADHATAVVEHRAKLRKPLTPRAAELLAGKFAQSPEPNAAADAMIANGWQGFETEWMANRGTGPPRSAPNGKGTPRIFDAFDRIIEHERSLEHPGWQPSVVASKRG